MYLMSLDKKRTVIKSKYTEKQKLELLEKYQIPTDSLDNLVKSELFTMFVQVAAQTLELKQEIKQTEDGELLESQLIGYVLNDRDVANLVLELLELDDEARGKKISEAKEILGMQ